MLLNQLSKNFSQITEENFLSVRRQRIILFLIILSAAAIRLSVISVPLIDRTAWKEIDYITISTNYWQHDYNFFKPEISWPAEPPYVTAMEFPLIPYAAGLLYPLLGVNEISVRMITFILSLLLILYVYKLTKLELGPVIALGAAFFSALLPINHSFNKFLFTEPALIFFSVFTLYQIDQWFNVDKKKYLFLGSAGLSLTVALKITELYLLLPLFWLAFRKYRFNFRAYKKFFYMIAISMIIPAAWYAYAYYLTQTSIDVFGIFQGHDKFQTLAMLSDISWYKIMYKRIAFDILGGNIGAGLFLIGIISAAILKKDGLFFFYLMAIIVFFVIVAEGNIDAPYRQLTIIPTLSVFSSIGILFIASVILTAVKKLFQKKFFFSFKTINTLLVLLFCISLLFILNRDRIFDADKHAPVHVPRWELAEQIKKYNNGHNKIISAGEYTVHVGGYDLSPVLYYYADATGWTLNNPDWNLNRINFLKAKGATLFVSYMMNREPESLIFINQMLNSYKLLYKNESGNIILLDLTQSSDGADIANQ